MKNHRHSSVTVVAHRRQSPPSTSEANILCSNIMKQCKSRPRLSAPSVFIRVRPEAETGGHANHVNDNDNVANAAKRLDGWTNDSIFITDAHQTIEHTFPEQVIPPEASQDQSFKVLIPGLLERFLRFENAYNALFFAYGQTGTGKTHTIFGAAKALKDTTEESQLEWGIFPRTCAKIFEYMEKERMKQEDSRIQSILTIGAVDFYIGTCVDLLNNRECVEVHPTTRVPLGFKERQLVDLEDVISFLGEVSKLRKSFGTLMNESDEDHYGSSRSHCALILTLRQLREKTGECTINKFTIVDLAGSERPSTTGGERVSAFEAVMEIMRGKETTGGTGALINYELHQLGHEIIKATDQYRKRGKYTPMSQLCLPAVQFLGSCFDGSSLLSVLVSLSQARHCGWETWFSLQYGTTLSKLRCPVRPRPVLSLKRLLEKKRALADLAKVELSKSQETGTPASKYYRKRKSMVVHTGYQLKWLEKLASIGSDESTSV